MSDLRELYQEMILDHAKSPRNRRAIEEESQQAEGFNPLCGDRLSVFVRLEGDRLADASFLGTGCAICMASASLMTERVRGKTRAEVDDLFTRFHDLVTGKTASEASTEDMGKLQVLAGVRDFPVRVKCATLAWHALRAALHQDTETISTES